MFERSLEEQNISHRPLEFSSGSSLRACLQRGLGVTICPTVAIHKELQEGVLRQLHWRKTSTSVIMIRHVDKWCSPLLSRFMEIALERMAS
jgi:DNA-binding transcriptional LysR family regulator